MIRTKAPAIATDALASAPGARDRLILALDVPDVAAARALVRQVGDSVGVFKIGMQLQFAGGLDYARELIDAGRRVFLDAKLYDIDETIERAVRNVAAMGVDFLTIHANRRTIPAAVRGRGDGELRILAVTVLTSLDAEDMADLYGAGADVAGTVLRRAAQALDGGADGVIASGQEAAAIRALAEARREPRARAFRIVTPGIRLPDEAAGDQKRVASPATAIAAGADYLVVGRPIYQADDPRGAAERIVADIERALAGAQP